MPNVSNNRPLEIRTGTLLHTKRSNVALKPVYLVPPTVFDSYLNPFSDCGKGKGRVLATALLTRELVTRSALQSRKRQLIGMS